MFDPLSVYNGYTALLAGLVTSFHCVAMCGPLACAFAPRPRSATDANGAGQGGPAFQENPTVILSAYHGAKLLAYGIIGALAGAFGSRFMGSLQGAWLQWLPWILVVFFLMVALRLDRHFPKPKRLGSLYRRLTLRFFKLPKAYAAGMLGLASPLLPCGPLYVIFGLALFTGSAWQGLEFALGFGLGTLPLLWFAQSRFMRLHATTSRRWLPRLQRGAALCAALVVAWRLRGTLGFETETFFCF